MSLIKKLLIKPTLRVLALEAPPAFRDLLSDWPEGATLARSGKGPFDIVIGFLRSKADADRISPKAVAAVKSKGVLWLAYPKKSSKIETDITRDIGWETIAELGWQGVTQIAIDETWSALRFRPSDEVGT